MQFFFCKILVSKLLAHLQLIFCDTLSGENNNTESLVMSNKVGETYRGIYLNYSSGLSLILVHKFLRKKKNTIIKKIVLMSDLC